MDYASGADARAATIAGEIDGFQADVVNALKVNAGGGNVRVVRHVGITNAPFIAILSGRDSGIESVADLAGRRIGLSLNTIIQYMTDSLLASVGISSADVEYVDVPGIWDRTQRLEEGNLAAATLPEPFGVLVSRTGHQVLIDDTNVDYVPEALNLRAEVLAEKGEAVRAFLAAYERAVETINALAGDHNAYQEFYDANDRGSGQLLKSTFISRISPLPTLSRARVPSEAEFSAVHDWALNAGLLSEAQAYADVVDGQYLPEVAEEAPAEAEEMTEQAAAPVAEQEMREPDLRITTRQSIYSLPILVAQDAGYFEEAGIMVELFESSNAEISQAAVIAGEIDGIQISSVSDLLNINRQGVDMRIVREVGVTNLPVFSIVTGPTSGIESIEDLAGTTFSILRDEYIEFLLDQIFESAGLSGQVEYEYVEASDVGNLVDRMARGESKVTLGDALLTEVMILYGGRVLADSSDFGYDGAQEMIGFRAQVLEEKGDAVRAFLSAFARAEEAINALEGNTQAYRDFVNEMALEQEVAVENLIFGGFVTVPIYAPPGLPIAEDFNPFQEWAIGAGLLERTFSYEELVDGSFMMEEMAEE